MKKIVFFDGDGTLWYPYATKYRIAPHWVYFTPGYKHEPEKHLVLTPTARSTIRALRQKGITTVVLSAHPHPPDEAAAVLRSKIAHFRLEGLFDEVHATRPYERSKGEFMLRILKRRDIPKRHALMIGDKYAWDYRPARENGIDALLIESDYEQRHPRARHAKKIRRLRDVLRHV